MLKFTGKGATNPRSRRSLAGSFTYLSSYSSSSPNIGIGDRYLLSIAEVKPYGFE